MTFDTLITHAHIATMSYAHGFGSHHAYGTIYDGVVGVQDGKITWLGQLADLPDDCVSKQHINAQGKWLTPALIDCHTHLVYAGNRSHEFEMRLQGVDYATIAKQGGGILSTVNATREASLDELYRQSVPRLKSMMGQGVGTIEIKSGYGLTLEDEQKMLTVANRLAQDFGLTVKKTYLAAHAVPPEYKDKADDYVQKVCEWLSVLHKAGLVDAVDAFCEHIAFNATQVEKIFNHAQALGLPVKLHAEQLSNTGATALVSRFGGLSADHIEYLLEDDVIAMKNADTVAVLLPTAFYCLKETKQPPILLFRKHNVAMAVSTDCNPGTSPSTSILLAMNMACTLFGLTPEESLAGVTVNAAKALNLQDKKGKIAIGMDADIAMWDIVRPADLSYLIGQNPLSNLMLQGKIVI